MFFLDSVRPFRPMDPDEVSTWSRIDGVMSVEALTEGGSPGTDALRRLEVAGLVDLAEPSPPSGRRRVLVVEPHMDDAVLSVGGLMWQRRRTNAFTVATLASRSNYTSAYYGERDFFDVDTVSNLRRTESEHAMRLLGGRHVTMGRSEAPLRCHPGPWSRAWYEAHAKLVDAFILHAASEDEVSTWADGIAEMLRTESPDEVWLPLGVGSHVDHELARNAWLSAVSVDPGVLGGAPVFLYAEEPYSVDFPDHLEAIIDVLNAAGAAIERLPAPISPADLEAKQRLVSVFGSQFKPQYMVPRVERAARAGAPGGTGYSERIHRLGSPPSAFDRQRLHWGRARVEKLAAGAAPFVRRHRDAERVRLLCGDPIPLGAADLIALSEAFPRATIEVHVRQAQWGGGSGDFVELGFLGAEPGAWLARIARLAVSDPSPVLVLCGLEPRRWIHALDAALFRSDVFFATTISDLTLALGRAPG